MSGQKSVLGRDERDVRMSKKTAERGPDSQREFDARRAAADYRDVRLRSRRLRLQKIRPLLHEGIDGADSDDPGRLFRSDPGHHS
ncbi:hypothetical protein, partial [Sphingomonas sp.]|uniref:hypothetical protein n=1 Tax=Sphingomonas sp. TaxID=28214 RepID=UPI00307E767F